jgi:hypothetical protein
MPSLRMRLVAARNRLFKKTLDARELGLALFDHDQKAALAGYAGRLHSDEECRFGGEVYNSERLYFDALRCDWCVFLALGDGAERDAVMGPYWRGMREWLQGTVAPPVPERVLLRGSVGEIKTLAAEPEEDSWERMTRRLAMYAESRKIRAEQGKGKNEPWLYSPSYVFTRLFCDLCGELDVGFFSGEYAGFSIYAVEQVTWIKSYRIVVQDAVCV